MTVKKSTLTLFLGQCRTACAPVTRGIVGWAVSLLILSAAWSAPAPACVIFNKYSILDVANECVVGSTNEDAVWDHDQQVPSDDDVATLDSSDFVLWSPSGYRLQVLVVHNVLDKPSSPIAFNIGTAVSDMAASDMAVSDMAVSDMAVSDIADGHGPGGVLPQQPIRAADPDLRAVLAGPDQAKNRPAQPNDALWSDVKHYAKYYNVIDPNGDIAAMIHFGAGAIHAIDNYSTSLVAATGLGGINSDKLTRFDGDAAYSGFQPNAPTISPSGGAGVGGSSQEIGGFGYYLAAVPDVIFSRDGLIYVMVIMIAYVSIAGLLNLMRALR